MKEVGMPSEKALKKIISAMKELRVKKMAGFKKPGDEDPVIEIEEASPEKIEELEDELED